MFAPSRNDARRFLVDAWAKYRAQQPLTDLERTAAAIVAVHPEYHPVIEDPDRHLERDWTPESGDVNPFLHLSLHLAVSEQLSVDRPPGIRAHFERLRAAKGDEHAALHALLDCLGETIWRAQRDGAPPDAEAYVACVERHT